jgi:tripartite-type tricarboxylate transporter receptor subunit TctC
MREATLPKRHAIALTLVMILAWHVAAPAAAQPLSDRPITMISPYALGGSSAIRVLAEVMGRILGQTVVLVARDGGSGVVGMQVLAAAPADGHTIAYTAITPLVIQPHLVRNVGYTLASFTTVCNVAENVLGIVVAPESPFRTMRDLAEAAKRRPLSFGSPGPNSVPMLAVERIRAAEGGDYTHIPFRGDQGPILETLAGRLDFGAIVVSSGGDLLRAGRVRLLGVFSARRHSEFPDVPTVEQQGVQAVQHSFAGIHAPAGTPGPVLDRLETVCRQATEDAEFRRFAANVGVVIDYRGRAEQAKLITELHASFASVLHDLGVQPQ